MTDNLNSSMTESKAPWERQEVDTNYSWAAFQIYRDMPPIGDKKKRRSYGNLARQIGHKSETTIQGWARDGQWRKRVLAYDEFMGSGKVAVKALVLEDYKQKLTEELTDQVRVIKDTANTVLAEVQRRVATGLTEMTAKELQDVIRVLKGSTEVVRVADDLARRSAGMSTAYKSEHTEEVAPETTEYFVSYDKPRIAVDEEDDETFLLTSGEDDEDE